MKKDTKEVGRELRPGKGIPAREGNLKRRGRKETEVARRVKEGNEKERQIQPVNSSLRVLHRLEHTEIHRVG